MRTAHPQKRKGFTLIELSMALVISMATGAMLLALFNQQLVFLKMFKTQNFLVEEAPIINNYVSRIVGNADRFRLHDSVANALAGTNPRLTSSPVVLLNFRQPDGTMRATILSYENRGSGNALYYYVVPASGVLGNPQWTVTKSPAAVSFAMVEGVLRMTLTGRNDESVTYSGSMK